MMVGRLKSKDDAVLSAVCLWLILAIKNLVDKANAKTILPIVKANIAKEAHMMTDESGIYLKKLGDFASHESVNHSSGEYVRGEAHTNTIENYYSIFKLGVDDEERADSALRGITGKRLTYVVPD